MKGYDSSQIKIIPIILWIHSYLVNLLITIQRKSDSRRNLIHIFNQYEKTDFFPGSNNCFCCFIIQRQE